MTDMERLRALSDAATPGPWRWYASGPGEGDIYLGQEGSPDEHHVLTPHVCPACAKRNAPCLSPSQADAAFIEAAVNYVRDALGAKS